MFTRTCLYQGVKCVSFSENVAHALNGWPFSTGLLLLVKFFKYLLDSRGVFRTLSKVYTLGFFEKIDFDREF